MQFTTAVLTAGLLASSVLAHPGGHENHGLSRREIEDRSSVNVKCAAAVAAMNKKRWAKRQLKRNVDARAQNASISLPEEQTPYYDVLQNDTCVLAPITTQGPYVWPRSQVLRQDMTEGEPGVPLILDVGVIDINTCEPMENVLVDFWHCNSTGSYSSFTKRSPDTPFEQLLDELEITDFEIGVTDLHTDDTTFLRGMWPTNAEGIMEMKTIVPGFYVDRAIHIHVETHNEWELFENGTIAGNNRMSTGQIYINETIAEQLMALEPYVSHTAIQRTTLQADSVFGQDSAGGHNPIIELIAEDGVDITKGVIGYITMGVDSKATLTGSVSGAPPGSE